MDWVSRHIVIPLLRKVVILSSILRILPRRANSSIKNKIRCPPLSGNLALSRRNWFTIIFKNVLHGSIISSGILINILPPSSSIPGCIVFLRFITFWMLPSTAYNSTAVLAVETIQSRVLSFILIYPPRNRITTGKSWERATSFSSSFAVILQIISFISVKDLFRLYAHKYIPDK